MNLHDFSLTALEKKYFDNTDSGKRKNLGQVFTPSPIARFMLRWICEEIKSGRILDPALGFGAFFREIPHCAENPRAYELVGYEVDPKLAELTGSVFSTLPLSVHCAREDFLQAEIAGQYDGIICNPPYIHFQDYSLNLTLIQEFNQRYGLWLNGFSNIYALFLIKALTLLKPNGRAAFIIPSEFLNADYGIVIKKFLLQSGALSHLIVFDPAIQLFTGFLTTSAILLFQNSGVDELKIFNLKDLSELAEIEDYLYGTASTDPTERIGVKVYPYNRLNPSIKWKNYYANLKINLHLEEKKHLTPFAKFASVRRGIATGANDFFTLTLADCKQKNLPMAYLSPCLTRACQAKYSIFGQSELQELIDTDKNVFLLNLNELKLNTAVKAYLDYGVENNYHTRYLTRNRKPWFIMEKSTPADFWVKTFGREQAVFVENNTQALNLTCFHSIYLNPLGQRYRKAIFLYLQTNLARETFEGQKRDYSTGLGKFEPNDIKQASILDFTLLNPDDLTELEGLYADYATCYRNKKQYQEIIAVCEKIFYRYW